MATPGWTPYSDFDPVFFVLLGIAGSLSNAEVAAEGLGPCGNDLCRRLSICNTIANKNAARGRLTNRSLAAWCVPLLLLFAAKGIIALGFFQADETVAIGVDAAEELLAEEEFLAGDVAIAVTVHLAEPHRATCRPFGLGGRGSVVKGQEGRGRAGPARAPRRPPAAPPATEPRDR